MNASNTTLIVIDVINFCAHQRCEITEWDIAFSKIREMVPRLQQFIKQYHEQVGGLVVITKTTPWTAEYLTENINELYTDPAAYYYSKDKSGFPEEFFEIQPLESDVVITKNHYDAFVNTELDKILKKNGIKYLVVTGAFADGCVMATICGGFSRGYNFVILKDLIETTDNPVRQKVSEGLKEFVWPSMYGKTMDAQDFIKLWQKKNE